MTALSIIAALLLILGGQILHDIILRRARLRTRLASLSLSSMPLSAKPRLQPVSVRRLGDVLAHGPLFGSREVGLLRKMLYGAGFPQSDAVDWYIGFKTALTTMLLLLASLWVQLASPSVSGSALALLGAAIVGLRIPDIVLRHRANRRREAIDRGLADALDLLLVCGEAGIGLELALERIALELQPVHPALAAELAVTVSEMRLLPDRMQSLANMADRVQLESVRAIASTLSQTIRYGTPLARALRTITADLRLDRQLAMEERTARLPVFVTLPMLMFILPSTALVVAGPAFLTLIAALRKIV